MDSFNYDIIGDIHGHALELEILLQKMGYRRKSGVYSHPEGRKVIFVGDFIDRGPKIRETLHLVRDMVLSGDAQAVMGNHEFNAISFHTPHVEKGGFFQTTVSKRSISISRPWSSSSILTRNGRTSWNGSRPCHFSWSSTTSVWCMRVGIRNTLNS